MIAFRSYSRANSELIIVVPTLLVKLDNLYARRNDININKSVTEQEKYHVTVVVRKLFVYIEKQTRYWYRIERTTSSVEWDINQAEQLTIPSININSGIDTGRMGPSLHLAASPPPSIARYCRDSCGRRAASRHWRTGNYTRRYQTRFW